MTFPDTIEIGKENEVEVLVNNTTDSYNLKIYGSPTKISSHSKYVETFNGSEYVSSSWTNFPIVKGQVPTKIKFRLKTLDDNVDYIYLKAGINASSNIYSDWVKVNVTEKIAEEIPTSDNENQPTPDPPIVQVEWPEEFFFNKQLQAKIKIKNTDEKYSVKVLASVDKKAYGLVKTINDNNLLSWNSNWDNFPTIQEKGEINFLIDYNTEIFYIKLRLKHSSDYIESDWVEVELKYEEPEKISETEPKVDEITPSKPQDGKIRIDYSKIPYKKVAFNVHDEKEPEPEKKVNIINIENKTKQKPYVLKDIVYSLWKKVLEILVIRKR